MNYIELFQENIDKYNSQKAIVDLARNQSITYGKLDELSSKVAGKLHKLGYRKNSFVIINMERSINYVVAYIGIIKAGMATVPCAPSYPKERLDYIQNDCKAVDTITDTFLEDLDKYEPYIDLAEGSDPFVLVYTSGSTGKPKGVLHGVEGVGHFINENVKSLKQYNRVVLAAVAPITFIVHTFEYLAILGHHGTTYIVDDETRKDVKKLEQFYIDNKISMGFISPQMLRLFDAKKCKDVELIVTGSERVSDIYFEGVKVVNSLGCTETLGGFLSFTLDKAYPNTPVGKPDNDTELFLLDEFGKQVPKGKEGEICPVGHYYVSYFNNPELTNKTFTKLEDGRVMVHTGDLGYLDENDNVVFVNRKDWMLKINGQRVEPGEIEQLLKKHKDIKQAVVKGFVNPSGQNYLCAFYESNKDISQDSLKAYLNKVLPAYMIPSFFVKLDRFPLNQNGKIDRIALKPVDSSCFHEKYEKPENPIEEKLCEAFEEILKCGKVGRNDDFFALGGNSINAISMIELTKIETLTPLMVINNKTPLKIAKALNIEDVYKDTFVEKDSYDLTDSQMGVYLECINDVNTLKYNISLTNALKKEKGIDSKKLAISLSKAINHHKILRYVVKDINGKPQLIDSKKEIEVPIIKLKENEVDKYINDFIKPFNYTGDLLTRACIIETENKFYIQTDIHHLIFDGTSNKILFEDFARTYNGEELEDEKLTLLNESVRESLIDRKAKEESLNYFINKFDGADADSNIISDNVVGSNEVSTSLYRCDLFKDDDNSLSDSIKQNGYNYSSFFLAAFGYIVAKFNNQNDVFIRTVNTGRQDPRLSHSIGMFVRTMPILCRVDENKTVHEYIKDVQDDYYESLNHDAYNYIEIASKIGVSSNIMFVYQDNMASNLRINGQELESLRYVKDSQAAITVHVFKVNDKYVGEIEYRTDIFSKDFIESLGDAYSKVIDEFKNNFILKEVNLLNEKQIQKLDSFNNTEVEYDRNKTLVELFREQAKANPNNKCVVYKDKCLTYKEVDELTDKVAKHLKQKGVKQNDVVAILINRSEYILICALASLKAGCAYLPIDASYPKERINLMIDDTKANIIFVDKDLINLIDDVNKHELICVDEIKNIKDEEIKLKNPKVDDKFVILYTSGSTGRPKGVIYNHSNALVMCLWSKKTYDLKPNEGSALYASFGFDAHVVDIYTPIISGACLHIIPENIRLDLLQLQKYFNDNNIVSTILTTQVGRQFVLLDGNKTIRNILIGGEKLVPLDPPENVVIHNSYGPTEGSVISTDFIVDKRYNDVPIGKPLDNLKAYVVDTYNRRLPLGAAGELLVTGPHVTQGYLNLKEKSDKVFINNPFGQGEYSRAYKTGDIVRYLGDGNIQFIGRHDMQVKIRGFRIELTEVEEVIGRCKGVKNVAVAAFDLASGGKYLAAYIVSDQKINEKEIKDFILKEKPAYMVPSVIMQIDKIPLNQNSKVNKKALPKPEFSAEDLVLPENETQKKIYDIVSKIMGHTNFGIDTDVYEAGLSSIGTVNLNVELSKEFNVTVKTSDIMQHCTVRSLEDLLLSPTQNEEYALQKDYPLTSSQMGVFIDCQSNPNTLNYNIPILYKIKNDLDIKTLKESIIKVVDNHPYIKTKLSTDANGNVRALRNDNDKVIIEEENVDKIPSINNIIKPFTLINSNLYRFVIYKTKDGNYLLIDLHHIVSDGTSETILFKDIEKVLNNEEIEKEKYTGYELALDEEKIKDTEIYLKAKDYYSSFLGSKENVLNIPKAIESDVQSSKAFNIELNIDYERIRKYCFEHNFSQNAFYNAVISLVLSRFSNKEDINYATVHNGRNDSRLQNAVMMLVKTMPISLAIDENKKVSELISIVQKQLIDNMKNDSFSYAEITNTFNFESDVLFTYEGDNFSKDLIQNSFLDIYDAPENYAKFPLTLIIKYDGKKLVMNASYLTNYFNEYLVKSICESVETAANSFVNKELLKDVIILSENSSSFIEKYNNTNVPFDNRAFSKVFEDKAKENKDKLCIKTSGNSKTYEETNKLANRIAHALVVKDIKKDNIIGLLLERSADILIAQIAINKAGAAFLSLLPSFPDDRIEYCLTNADSPYVITTKEIFESRKSLFENKTYKVLLLEDLYEEKNESNLDLDIDQNSLAYCIYTSGSTGTPKGVMIENHNLSNFVETSDVARNLYNYNDDVKTGICVGSFSFDISILETLILLCAGKTIVLASDKEIHDPLALSNLIKDNNVDILACTPTFISNMVDIKEFAEAFKGVKALMLGAEAFPKGLFEKLSNLSKDIRIMNAYGPTEATISCSSKVLLNGDNITIGGPSGNVKMFAVDKNGHIQPPYASGELIICGEGVGRGYIKLKEKTAKTFFKLNSINAYRSGDIVRVNKDGEFEFFGRDDNQVKVRGYRIELDEIEKVCCLYDGIKQCKVIVRNNGSEDYLCMFFTASKQVDLNDLITYLGTKLTYYMVPHAIKQLDVMPLNPSGKVDKNALPEVVVVKRKSSKRKAKQSTEQLVCEQFKKALNVEEVYVDDNFFELGGTSISASKVVMAFMSEGIDIQYQNIFENPTPESLARYIDSLNIKENVNSKDTNDISSLNEFKEALKYNNLNYAESVTREDLKDVFLTGATGFLGIHVLAELLMYEKGHVYCLVRKGKYSDPKDRLLKLAMYYFDDDYEELINERVTIIDADITDDDLTSKLKDYKFDTIINCSACVKHYAADDVLERINVHGVENLIDLALEKNARLIQISTTSLPGMHTKDSYEKRIRMYEDQMFLIDSMNNKYLLSKYHAEQKMFNAIEKRGLRGKVIRVGNLMGRYEDGEFQFNMNTNAFLNGVRGFATMGICPISHTTDPVSFAPIDLTAKVVRILAGTDDRFTAFNGDSRYSFDEYQLIESCNRCGIHIEFIEDEKYYNEYRKRLADEKVNARLSGLMTNDIQGIHPVETDNKFTAYVLYRLGFAWPFVDNKYLDKVITSIKTLGFFDYEEK